MDSHVQVFRTAAGSPLDLFCAAGHILERRGDKVQIRIL